jgi:hypothetical protein
LRLLQNNNTAFAQKWRFSYNTCIVVKKELAMTSWEDLTPLEQARETYWDMYKDAYGVRPRGVDTSGWSLEYFEAEFKILGAAIEKEETDRKASEARAIVRFEDHVQNLMHTGTTRERVIDWLMRRENIAGDDYDYFCYTQGLPYGYFKKAA